MKNPHTWLPERNLDVMRAVAVLLVVLDHAMGAGRFAEAFNWWAVGRLGVLLFFVHTSLVLMASLERGGKGRGWAWRFYVRRACRLYPLAIVCILVVAALAVPTSFTTRAVVANVLLIQNLITDAPNVIGVLWSLPVEAQMYVLLPACYLAACKSWKYMVTLIIAFAGAGILVTLPLPGVWRLNLFLFGPCFCGGVLAYHLLRRRRKPALGAWAWIPVLVVIAAGLLIAHPDPERVWIGWVPCLVLGASIPQVRELRPSFLTRTAHWIAKYSYGIYLVHKPLLWLWRDRLMQVPEPAQWVGWIASAGFASVLLYRLVEAPMIRVGNRLVAKRPLSALDAERLEPAP